jgi:modification methylase
MFIPEALPLRQRIIRALGSGVNNTPTAYCPTHEEILVIAKSEFRLRDRGASGVGSVWYIPHSGHDTNSWHPAPFPLALAERVLETTMPALVCDPFSGSGTVGRAAKRYGIPFIGCDRNAAYVERANQEIAKERKMTVRQKTMDVFAEQAELSL